MYRLAESQTPDSRKMSTSRFRSESPVDDEDDDYKYSDSFVSDEEPPSRTKSDVPNRRKINPASRKPNGKGRGKGRGAGKNSRAQSETPRVDPVIQRVLSARKLKINELRNNIEEIKTHMTELQEENKLLKKTQRRQERALERFDNTESDLPQLMSRHSSEVRALREQLRKTKEKYDRTDRYLRDAEDELEKVKGKLKKYKKVADENNLMERDELSKKVHKYELDMEEKDVRIKELEKHVANLNKNHRHEIGIEMARNRESKKHLEEIREENEKLEQQLKDKIKELEMRNIYANRTKQSHSVPGSYGGTPRDSPHARRKRRPSQPDMTPREKAKQFEEKRREELRLQRESRPVPRLNYDFQEDDEDDYYQPKSSSKPSFRFRSMETNGDNTGYKQNKATRSKYAPKSEPLRPSKGKPSTKLPPHKSSQKIDSKSSWLDSDGTTSKPTRHADDSDGYKPSGYQPSRGSKPKRSYDNDSNTDDQFKRPWDSERKGYSNLKNGNQNDSPQYDSSPKFESKFDFPSKSHFESSPRQEATSRKKWPWEKDNTSDYESNVSGNAPPTDDGLNFGSGSPEKTASSKPSAMGAVTSTYDSGYRFGRTTDHRSSAMGTVTSTTAESKPGRQLQEKSRQDRERIAREQKLRQEQEESERQRQWEMEERERQEEEERREREEKENRERERQRREEEDRRRREEDERREMDEWNIKMQREKIKREAEERKREAEEREREERARRDREREEQERRAQEERERMKMDAQMEEERRKKDALLAKLREIDEGGGGVPDDKNKKDFFITKSNSDAGSTSSSKRSYSFSRPIENLHNGMPSQEVTVPYIEKQKKRREKDEESGYMPSFGSTRTGQKSTPKKPTGGTGNVLFNDEFSKPPSGKSKGTKKNDLMAELFGSKATEKNTKNDDDIFSSGKTLNAPKTTKTSGFPWDDEPKSTTTKTTRQRDSSSSALFGGGSALLDDDVVTNDTTKLLPRRQRQNNTLQSWPAVTAVDHFDDDIEEVIL